MKLLLALTISIFVITVTKPETEKTWKAILLFKGIENIGGYRQLKFADKQNKTWLFDAPRSNTVPYIFYSKAPDGSLVENEKIRGSWFVVSYTFLKNEKTMIKIIIKVESIKN